MPSIDARITALTETVHRRRMEQEAPIDGLSQSLFAFEKEMVTLDEQGKATLLEALNNPNDGETVGLGLTLEDLERWIGELKQ